MSAALLRQALEFVDPDESVVKRKKRGASSGGRGRHQGASGQVTKPLKQKLRKKELAQEEVKRSRTKRAIRELLKLSRPTVDPAISSKIVERAVKGQALADKIQVNTEPEKSILFSDNEEQFDQFEEELFCS